MRANVCKSMGVAVLERLMLLYSITIEAAEHMRITKLSGDMGTWQATNGLRENKKTKTSRQRGKTLNGIEA